MHSMHTHIIDTWSSWHRVVRWFMFIYWFVRWFICWFVQRFVVHGGEDVRAPAGEGVQQPPHRGHHVPHAGEPHQAELRQTLHQSQTSIEATDQSEHSIHRTRENGGRACTATASNTTSTARRDTGIMAHCVLHCLLQPVLHCLLPCFVLHYVLHSSLLHRVSVSSPWGLRAHCRHVERGVCHPRCRSQVRGQYLQCSP